MITPKSNLRLALRGRKLTRIINSSILIAQFRLPKCCRRHSTPSIDKTSPCALHTLTDTHTRKIFFKKNVHNIINKICEFKEFNKTGRRARIYFLSSGRKKKKFARVPSQRVLMSF